MLIRPIGIPSPPTPLPEAVKKFNGRDALLRVRDGKPNTDADHRVPTGSRLYAEPNLFTVSRVGARGADQPGTALNTARRGCVTIIRNAQESLLHANLPASTFEELRDDVSMHVSQAEMAALILEGKFGVIDSEAMQKGGMKVVNMHRVLGYVV